jgi:rhodanese-related sulfurtransferase
MTRASERRPARRASLLREAGALLCAATALAAVVWAARDDRIPLLPDARVYEQDLPAPVLTVDEALRSYEEGLAIFVDTREETGEETICVPGAFFVRESSFDDDLYAAREWIYPEDDLVLYGSGDLLRVGSVAARFLERGYENVRIMAGGLEAWRRAGGEVVTRAEEAE